MNSAILIQQASGKHSQMLAVTDELHAAKCQAHGVERRTIIGRTPAERYCHPMWDKIEALACVATEKPTGTLAIWLDADGMIVGDEGIHSAPIGAADLGMVRNRAGEFNAGAIWIRCSPAVAEFLWRCWKLGPMWGQPEWHDQGRINAELRNSGLDVVALDSRWNSYSGAADRATPPVQVRAWHSTTEPFEVRLALMKSEVKRHTAKTV